MEHLTDLQDTTMQVSLSDDPEGQVELWVDLSTPETGPNTPCVRLPPELDIRVAGISLNDIRRGGLTPDSSSWFGWSCTDPRGGVYDPDEVDGDVLVEVDDGVTVWTATISGLLAKHQLFVASGSLTPGAQVGLGWTPATDSWTPPVPLTFYSELWGQSQDAQAEVQDDQLVTQVPSGLSQVLAVTVGAPRQAVLKSCDGPAACTVDVSSGDVLEVGR